MASAAGLVSASWDHGLSWLDDALGLKGVIVADAEVERLASGARPCSEWVCPNELPSFP